MHIDDMRYTILAKEKKFQKGAVKVFGPDEEIMEVRDWVKLVKNNWLEKWRQYSSWYGSDGKRHSLTGSTGILQFIEVMPITGPEEEVNALRRLVQCELLKAKKKLRTPRANAKKVRE